MGAARGNFLAERAERLTPPALPALADKRPELAGAYMRQQLIVALRAKAEALMAEVRKGATMEQAAGQAGAQVVRQSGMERLKVHQYQPLGQEFVQQIFTANQGKG